MTSRTRESFQAAKSFISLGARRVHETYICGTHDTPYLLHGVEVWAQATVHGEDFFINDGRDGQTVKAVREGLPQLDVVPSFALVVEAINAVDRCAFVIATENEKILWILDLVCK
jgi:hypothetical protein